MASPGSVVIQFLVDAKKAARDAADLAKNFGKVDSEADDLDSTLSGLESELDSIGRETASLKQDMGKAGAGFDSVGDDAEKAADRVRRAARDMSQGVHAGAADIDVETGAIRGSMKETGAEAGAELIGSIAEGVGSGTASLKDTVQGTLGGITNIAASIGGPVGIAAGAAAAGIGLVFAAVTAEQEKASEMIKTVSDALVELGETSGAAARKVIWDSWLAKFKEAGGSIDQISDGLRRAGVQQGTFQNAISGSAAAQEKVRTAVQKQIEKYETLSKKQGGLGFLESQRLNSLKAVNKQLGAGTDSIAEANDEMADMEVLTGDTEQAARAWAAKQKDVYTNTHKIRDDMEVIKGSHDVNFNVLVNGKKVSPGTLSKLDPGTWAAPPATGPAAAAQATLTTVNVYTSGPSIPNSPRAVRALLDSHDLRMGRRPGTPRAVAW